MIAKIESINFTQNALEYCERGGEPIYWNKCFGDSKDLYTQMQDNNAFSTSTKPTFHAKLRIAPEDVGKLNTQDWIDIAEKYALKIGFNNNPYCVYIHEEGTDKEHIHLVGSRVKENNSLVSDSFTNYKNLDFCREIEQDYNLRKVERKLEAIKQNIEFVSKDKRIPPLVEKIKNAIEYADSMDDFVFHLNNNGIKVHKGRGIAFTDENGVYLKGSLLGRQFSLKNIEKAINSQVQISYNNPITEIKVEQHPQVTPNEQTITDFLLNNGINPKHYEEEEDDERSRRRKRNNNMSR